VTTGRCGPTGGRSHGASGQPLAGAGRCRAAEKVMSVAGSADNPGERPPRRGTPL